ncbi:MAG: lysylphosphatidylglycerol synthase domain-containing protein [Anaerolineae bacterium]|jgi:hypothetical protein
MKRIRQIAGHPAVRIAYFALLVGAAIYYLYRWGDRLPELVGQVQWAWLLAALAATVFSALVYSVIQYTVYRRLGAGVSLWATFRIITIAQLGKYLPGKVMFAGNYYLLSRAAGISNLQIGTSFVISQALWMLTASLCGLPVLALLNPVLRYTVLLLPLALALLLHPRFLEWLLGLGRRVAGRSQEQTLPLPQGLAVTFYIGIAGLYLLNWALAGLGAWFSLRAFGSVALGVYPLALAALALGTVAGFVALFAPVGLGVREGVGAVILSPVVGADVALLGLVLLRGVTVVVDLSLALLSMLAGRREAPSPGGEMP